MQVDKSLLLKEIERLKELAAGGLTDNTPRSNIYQACRGAYNVLCALEEWVAAQKKPWSIDDEPEDPHQVRERAFMEEGFHDEDDIS